MGVRQHGLVARRGHGAIAIFRLVSVREEETLVARLSAHVTEILNARPQATLALATELISRSPISLRWLQLAGTMGISPAPASVRDPTW